MLGADKLIRLHYILATFMFWRILNLYMPFCDYHCCPHPPLSNETNETITSGQGWFLLSAPSAALVWLWQHFSSGLWHLPWYASGTVFGFGLSAVVYSPLQALSNGVNLEKRERHSPFDSDASLFYLYLYVLVNFIQLPGTKWNSEVMLRSILLCIFCLFYLKI